jgi:predicted N-formylglutamate amidohydrolase
MINEIVPLKTEFENARIVDFRDPESPNNLIVITAEHASNALPEGYNWTDSDRAFFVDEHWGYDKGSLDIAMHLAKELKCVLVYSLYSRLLVDVNRDLPSQTLFRKSGDGRLVDLNRNMDEEEEDLRIQKYHLSYYRALREVSMKVDPMYIFGVHSFTPLYEGNPRTLEMGILVNYSDDMAERLCGELKKRHHNVEINQPYDGKEGLAALGALLYAKVPVTRQGIQFEFRNDLITDPSKVGRIKDDTLQAVKAVCNYK